MRKDHGGYVRAVKRAAKKLRKERLLLKEDEKRINKEAKESDVLQKPKKVK